MFHKPQRDHYASVAIQAQTAWPEITTVYDVSKIKIASSCLTSQTIMPSQNELGTKDTTAASDFPPAYWPHPTTKQSE